jgi:hypothetical protein
MKSKSLIKWGPPYQYELTLFQYIYLWFKFFSLINSCKSFNYSGLPSPSPLLPNLYLLISITRATCIYRKTFQCYMAKYKEKENLLNHVNLLLPVMKWWTASNISVFSSTVRIGEPFNNISKFKHLETFLEN